MCTDKHSTHVCQLFGPRGKQYGPRGQQYGPRGHETWLTVDKIIAMKTGADLAHHVVVVDRSLILANLLVPVSVHAIVGSRSMAMASMHFFTFCS